ncbi:glycosyltransferase family 2 protein, partial [Actinomyces sp. MRS3W]|uniref:glycosyltransferase family 2 protein n=1 Tax=Actinomyces sp. MRS3W TaxID=2800796 RepID=UPI0028FD00FC
AQQPHAPHRADAGPDSAPTTAVSDPDPDRSFRARRIAQLTAWATFSAQPVPLLLAWIVLLGVARAAWRLLTKTPALARDEMAAALAVARRGTIIRRGRRRLAAHQSVRRAVLAELYVRPADIRATRRDRRRQERERVARAAARSELEQRELAALTRRRRLVLVATLLVVTAIAGFGLSQVLFVRTLTGGALPGLGASWRELWDAAWSTWAASGDGYPAALTPLFAVLAVPVAIGSWLGLDGDALVHLLLILAIPLAALGAWYAAGTVTRRHALRAWAACVWALAPTLMLAVGQGRLTAVMVHVTLPWALTALSRAVGADRRDVVLSGLVGAHHATAQEKAELDRFASARMEDLAVLADDDAAPEPQDEDPASMPHDVVAEPSPDGAGADGSDNPDDSAEDSGQEWPEPADTATPALVDVADAETPTQAAARIPAPPEAYGPGSPTAAAVAGLLFSLIVAAAPVTAALVVVGLILLCLLVRRSALRLLLTLVPVVATAAPAWWRAGSLARADGATDAARYLLTDTGLPIVSAPPSTIETILGMPVDVESLLTDPALALAAKVLLAVVPAAAVCGLFTSGRRGHRARAGFLMTLGGLALAAVSTRVITAVGTQADGSGSLTVTSWAGTGISFALAGLLTAAVAAGDAAYAALPAHATGWRRWGRAGLVGISVIAAAVPLTVGGAWALRAHGSTTTGADAAILALRPAGTQIPVIASEIQSSAASGRVLVLTSTESGLLVRVWRGDGAQLTDVVPDVLFAQLTERVPAATHAPSIADGALPTELADPADAELTDLVVRAITGQDEDVADGLAAHDIAVVVLTDASGDDLTASARAGLEATPGLEQLARTASGTSWRVSPEGAVESARATLVAASGNAVTVPASAPMLRTTLDAGTAERVLVLAERADGAWHATLNGETLETVAPAGSVGRWRQAFTVPADSGELVVTHGSLHSNLVARCIQIVWVITALIALPLRRQRSTV